MNYRRTEGEGRGAGADLAPSVLAPDRWQRISTDVRKALKFIKGKGAVTAEQLVEWDATHGRRLFTWDDEEAASEWRLQEARFFLNRFRRQFEGMRVRAFIHVREDAEAGIDRDAYYTVETISNHTGMRDQVVADISGRMTRLAGELKLWRLTIDERAALFARLAQAME